MIGALGVAGLLATVLALASSPATAQQVVTITTDDIPGIYTVSWETSGTCDPSKPDADTTITTDGATGSKSGTVGKPAGTDDNAVVGDPDFDKDDNEIDRGEPLQFSVAIGTHCVYNWKASFTSGLPGDEGTRCSPVAGARDEKLNTDDDYDADPVVLGNHPQRSIRIDDTPDDLTDDEYTYFAANAFTFDVATGECAKSGVIKVTIGPAQCEVVSVTRTTTPAGTGVTHSHDHDDPSTFQETHTHTHDAPLHRHYHGKYYLKHVGATIAADANGNRVEAGDYVDEDGNYVTEADRVDDTARQSEFTDHDGLPDHYHQHPGEVTTTTTSEESCDPAYSDTGAYLLTDPTVGAILNTTFTVTATPVKDSNDECQAVTKEAEFDDNDTLSRVDDAVVVNLPVLVETLELTKRCEYDVVADLPAGFNHTAGDPKSNEEKVETDDFNAVSGIPPACNAPAVPAGTDCVPYDPPVTLDVAVAVRSIYILQNVVGDSGGANVRYTLTLDKECAIPHDLPENLASKLVGGIQTKKAVTVVELREGFFNISAAVMGREVTDIDSGGRTFAPRYAMNADGEPCTFTAAVSHMPDICDAAEDSITANAVTGADSSGRVVTTFDIGCEEAMDDEDPMPTGSEDAGEEMVDDDPMPTGGEDAGEEMVDDDGMGEMDDGDAMGPPPDEPTG